MYQSFHTAVAIIILALPLPPVITVPLSFVSHHFVDRYGETGLPYALPEEAALTALTFGIAIATDHTDQAIAGLLLGNGMDIIDKVVGPALGIRENSIFNCHMEGFSEKLPITEQQTVISNVAATGLAAMTLISETSIKK